MSNRRLPTASHRGRLPAVAAQAPALTQAQHDDLAQFRHHPHVAALLAGMADAHSASEAVSVMVPLIITLARINAALARLVPAADAAARRVLANE